MSDDFARLSRWMRDYYGVSGTTSEASRAKGFYSPEALTALGAPRPAAAAETEKSRPAAAAPRRAPLLRLIG